MLQVLSLGLNGVGLYFQYYVFNHNVATHDANMKLQMAKDALNLFIQMVNSYNNRTTQSFTLQTALPYFTAKKIIGGLSKYQISALDELSKKTINVTQASFEDLQSHHANLTPIP